MEPSKEVNSRNKTTPPRFEERLSNGKMGQNKHNYKIYQSPSVEIAGLNKSPGKILRSVNRKHAFMAMDQEEKQKLSEKVCRKLTGDTLKRRLENADCDDSCDKPQKKRETENGPKEIHICKECVDDKPTTHNLLATQSVTIENDDDDDDDDE